LKLLAKPSQLILDVLKFAKSAALLFANLAEKDSISPKMMKKNKSLFATDVKPPIVPIVMLKIPAKLVNQVSS
jgi:hypothetical protein